MVGCCHGAHSSFGVGGEHPPAPPSGSPDFALAESTPCLGSALGKLGLGPGLKTDWLEGCKKGRSPQESGGMGGVLRLGAGISRTHAQVHIALSTSLKIHVERFIKQTNTNPSSLPSGCPWKERESGGLRKTQVRSFSLFQVPCRS